MRVTLLLLSFAAVAIAQDGAAVYRTHCATCHDAPAARVPPQSALRAMSVPRVLNALEHGSMKTVGDTLSATERYAVTIYLAAPAPKVVPVPQSAFCSGDEKPSRKSSSSPAWAGWSTDITNTRFQDSAAAGLTAADVPRLKVKWAFSLGDETDARSQPAVADGRLFLGTQDGAVYSLDAHSGCIHWTSKVEADIRSPITAGATGRGKKTALYFGDGHANAYALDAATGKTLWKVKCDEHFAARITAVPLLHRGTLYVTVASFEEALPPLPGYQCCTFRGSVVALDAATGRQIWKTFTIPQAPQPTEKNKAGIQMHGPSGAAVWSTPTFDEQRDVLYVGTGDNYSDPPSLTSDAVLALDPKTGKVLWTRQMTAGDAYNNACGMPGSPNCPAVHGHDFDFGQPPILVSLANGKTALAIGQKSGMAYALDPDKQGEVLWERRVGTGGPLGGVQWGSATDGHNMYVALSDLQISGVAADKSSPLGYRLKLDPNHGGGLFALNLNTGEPVWTAKPPSACAGRERCSPSQSQAVTAIPGVVFSGSLDGHLRAYSAASGDIVWDVDTERDYPTINGPAAHGGSLDGPGPVVAGGILYVSSGYGQFGGMPGNVFLAFSVDGQ